MFEGSLQALIEAVERLGSTGGPAELLALLALRERVEQRVIAAVGAFDRQGEAEVDGATSTVNWLVWRAGLSRRDAKRLVLDARHLHVLPATVQAWHAGRLNSGQVQAILANGAAHLDRLGEHEAAVVAAVSPFAVPDTAAAMRHWAARVAATTDRQPDDTGGDFVLASLPDGTWHLAGNPSAVQGDILQAAARLFGPDDPTRPAARCRMEGLVAACAFALAHRNTPKPARHRPHVSWHVHERPGEAPVAANDDGIAIDAAATAMALCDADVQRVVWGADGHLLDYGRTTRVVPNGLRRAVMTRDRHCRFPGCDRPAAWGDIHHVTPWYDGGHTSLENLVQLCRHHHTVLHRPGWHAKLLPDATLEVTDPAGTTHTSRPPPRC